MVSQNMEKSISCFSYFHEKGAAFFNDLFNHFETAPFVEKIFIYIKKLKDL